MLCRTLAFKWKQATFHCYRFYLHKVFSVCFHTKSPSICQIRNCLFFDVGVDRLATECRQYFVRHKQHDFLNIRSKVNSNLRQFFPSRLWTLTSCFVFHRLLKKNDRNCTFIFLAPMDCRTDYINELQHFYLVGCKFQPLFFKCQVGLRGKKYFISNSSYQKHLTLQIITLAESIIIS